MSFNQLIESSMRRLPLHARSHSRFLVPAATQFSQLFNARRSLAASCHRCFASQPAARARSPHNEDEDDEDAVSVNGTHTAVTNADAVPEAKSDSDSSVTSDGLSLNPDNYDISPPLLKALKQTFKIKDFFPIQASCYTPIVSGHDIMGQSKTGTGKTLAFVLPLVEKLRRDNIAARTGEMSILIMEPTRELAVQVAAEITKLAPSLRVTTVYGGAGFGQQTNDLLRGVDICVATPGRLQDLLDRGVCTLRGTRSVVLDEADEMLRRGFREQIEKILSEPRVTGSRKRQMLLFSATMPGWVKEISAIHQTNPVTVNKVDKNENSTPVNLVHQAIIAPSFITDRVEMIGELIAEVKGRVILFVNSKAEADMLCENNFSARLRADAAALHGDVSQRNRDAIMADFKAGKFKLLVATDVAARGLDIPNVALVIQSGLPRETSFYVHRAGRTARAGKNGRAVLLYKRNEREDVAALGRETGVKFQFTTSPRVEGQSLSALTGEVGYVTIESRGPHAASLMLDDVLAAISDLSKAKVFEAGKSEFVSDGILVDVPQEAADKLIEALKAGETSRIPLAVTQVLPDELLGSKNQYHGFAANGGGGGNRRGNVGRGPSRDNFKPSYKNNFSSGDRKSYNNPVSSRMGNDRGSQQSVAGRFSPGRTSRDEDWKPTRSSDRGSDRYQSGRVNVSTNPWVRRPSGNSRNNSAFDPNASA